VAPEPNRFRLLLAAREENVAVARAAVASAAAALPFTLAEIEELRIAVSEAVSNAVLHAYGARGGEIEVAVEVRPEAIEVRIVDAGRGIADVERARRPEYSTLDGHLGLGFAFMEAMADELDVESEVGRGTRVRLVKRPQGDGGEGGTGGTGGATGDGG
jgi:stage II sporulation protein AB (anti-sigma F factor)